MATEARTDDIALFRAVLGDFNQQKVLLLSRYFYNERGVDEEGLAIVRTLIDTFTRIKQASNQPVETAVMEWNQSKNFFIDLGIDDYSDVWDIFQRGPAFGSKKVLSFLEASMHYLFKSKDLPIDFGKFVRPPDFPPDHPARLELERAETAHRTELGKATALAGEKDAFLQQKANLSAQANDESLTQMKRSRAAAQLTSLQFDDAGHTRQTTSMGRRLKILESAYNEARSVMDKRLGEFRRKVERECGRALGLPNLPHSEDCLVAGELKRRVAADGVLGGLVKRWWELREVSGVHWLTWYASVYEDPKGEVSLTGRDRVTENSASKEAFSFILFKWIPRAPEMRIELIAESEEQKTRWIQGLLTAISKSEVPEEDLDVGGDLNNNSGEVSSRRLMALQEDDDAEPVKAAPVKVAPVVPTHAETPEAEVVPQQEFVKPPRVPTKPDAPPPVKSTPEVRGNVLQRSEFPPRITPSQLLPQPIEFSFVLPSAQVGDTLAIFEEAKSVAAKKEDAVAQVQLTEELLRAKSVEVPLGYGVLEEGKQYLGLFINKSGSVVAKSEPFLCVEEPEVAALQLLEEVEEFLRLTSRGPNEVGGPMEIENKNTTNNPSKNHKATTGNNAPIEQITTPLDASHLSARLMGMLQEDKDAWDRMAKIRARAELWLHKNKRVEQD